jgi:hypothetical protein
MNKTELLALCVTLGIVANASMTQDELKALIAGYKPTVADATNTEPAKQPSVQPVAVGGKGVSTVTGFRYVKGGWCKVSMKNGASGIVGTDVQFTFPAMMTLKGTQTEVRFERLKDKGEYARYSLEWSLE